MFAHHPVPVGRMEGANPELRVIHPFLDAVAEELHDLRARVEVGGQLVRPVDVEDRRRALHQGSERLRMQLLPGPRHAVTPAR